MYGLQVHGPQQTISFFEKLEFLNFYISASSNQISTKLQDFAKFSIANLDMSPAYHLIQYLIMSC